MQLYLFIYFNVTIPTITSDMATKGRKKENWNERNYQYFMVNKCSKRFSTHSFNLWSQVLYRIKIRDINAALIWMTTIWAEFLDIHTKNTYIYSFNLLKQKNNLKWTKECDFNYTQKLECDFNYTQKVTYLWYWTAWNSAADNKHSKLVTVKFMSPLIYMETEQGNSHLQRYSEASS